MPETSTTYVGRLAPSPTGALHLGNVRTFAVAWLRARQRGGRLIMRIEDLDGPKIKRGATGAMIDHLRWLGFDWDEGPDPPATYVQSRRAAVYARSIRQLAAASLLYPCVCSRREIAEAASAPHGDAPLYPQLCRERFSSWHAAWAEPGGAALRFRVPAGARIGFCDGFVGPVAYGPDRLDDFVVVRKNGGASYQLAVVVDDAAMGVTEVVRGDDLLSSTASQLLLYRALGLPAPTFFHVPLVLGPDGRRLAKRHGDTRVALFREQGVSAERIVGWLAQTLGIEGAPAECTLAELIPLWRDEALPTQPYVLASDNPFAT